MSNRERRRNKRAKRKAEKARQKRLQAKGVSFEITPEGKAVPSSIPIPPEVAKELKTMEERYIAKTGHPIPPDMTMAEVFKELSGDNLDDTYLPGLLQAMWDAKLNPAKIYATFKTDGLLPTRENMDLIDPDLLNKFDEYLDEFNEIVDRGENPFVGSVLENVWEEYGHERLSSTEDHATPDDADKTIATLPVSVPFTKEEWSSKTVSDITNDKRFMKFYIETVEKVQTSEQARGYIEMFTMITHIERFPEFSRKNYGKFLKEAKQQVLTAHRFERALEVVVNVSGPNEALPTALTAFEFLTVVHGFGSFMKERLETGPRTDELLEAIGAMAMMALFIAVNVQFGLARAEDWQLGRRSD